MTDMYFDCYICGNRIETPRPPSKRGGHVCGRSVCKKAHSTRVFRAIIKSSRRYGKMVLAQKQENLAAAMAATPTVIKTNMPTRFVEDVDPADDPRFGRRKKA